MISEWLHDASGLAAEIPPGFSIGVTSSAFQVEGAVRADGREPSTWDTFMAQPGRILDGSTAAVAADSYHRVEEDVRLLSQLGVDSYRFSFGWPRVQPTGRGGANRSAVAFYDRLVDGLLAAGIRPMATLFSWDLPEPVQHTGGWLNRDTAYRLADYAYLAGEVFGDRIESWVTVDQPATVTLNGYAVGVHAPGAALLFDALPAAHHQLLGHGLAVEALRAADVRGTIGIANAHTPVEPASEGRADALHAALFDTFQNRLYADPVLTGRYPEPPEEFRTLFGALDEVEPSDLEVISRPVDFYGVSYSGPTRVRAGSASPGAGQEPDAASATRRLPFSLSPWPEFPRTGDGAPSAPEYVELTLQHLVERYGTALPPVVITASGASYPDTVAADGSIDDQQRISYLAEHLAATAVNSSGLDIRGYYVRSLLDGWEWSAGFSQRFGLVRVDPRTQDRTPKRSYRWLQQVLSAR